MIDKLREAAAMALEALENERCHVSANWDNIVKAITALQEALAAPQPVQQEPVGTAGELFTMSALERLDVRPSTKIYLNAAPVRTKNLTDDEIDEIWTQTPWSEFFHFARAVIAADREKNK